MKFGTTVSGSNIGLRMEAQCRNCGMPIKRRAQNGPWKHTETGSYNCDNTDFLKADPKDAN